MMRASRRPIDIGYRNTLIYNELNGDGSAAGVAPRRAWLTLSVNFSDIFTERETGSS
ncbi:MAG: hypothetical protein JNN01_13035 [Opitutaceae bacterium]|nr:hypothetical protein [Opitutaceae bacterium]